MSEKKCTKCDIIKSFNLFHKDKHQPDGMTYQCIQCRKEKRKEWMQKPETKKMRAKKAREYRATKRGKEYIKNINYKMANKVRFGGNRDKVLEIYSICNSCGTRNSLCVHHIDGNGRKSNDPNNSLDNLTVLCKSCHMKLHRKLQKEAASV